MFLNNLCQFWTYSVLRLYIWEHTFSETKLKGEIVAAQCPCRPAVTRAWGFPLLYSLPHILDSENFKPVEKLKDQWGEHPFLSPTENHQCFAPLFLSCPPVSFMISFWITFQDSDKSHSWLVDIPCLFSLLASDGVPIPLFWSFVTYTFWRVGVTCGIDGHTIWVSDCFLMIRVKLKFRKVSLKVQVWRCWILGISR